ncbi:MAG TPA: hypothetical protein VFK14_00205 [Solirubrobacterales bacterium]|nr:hypothetical protein [Solirubrobacterales bacterium]
MPTKLMNTVATLIKRREGEEKDEFGAAVTSKEEVQILCEIQQRKARLAGSEGPGEGETSATSWLGFFPAETDLRTSDAIVVEGIGKLELDGEPWHVHSPRTGAVSHIEATLRRTAGNEDP